MSKLDQAPLLDDRRRAAAVLHRSLKWPIENIARLAGCGPSALRQELRHDAGFRWRMGHAREVAWTEAVRCIVRAASTDPAAEKWLGKHFPRPSTSYRHFCAPRSSDSTTLWSAKRAKCSACVAVLL